MKAEWRAHRDVDREGWKALLGSCAYANFFVDPAYMDLIAPDWSGIELRDRDARLLAVMPLELKRKGPFTYAVQPPLSQYWGIFFADVVPEGIYKQYSWKGKAIKAILDAIPRQIRYFLYNFAPAFDYPLPFHWANYQLRTRYTYQIDLTRDADELRGEFAKNTRYDLRRSATYAEHIRTTRDVSALKRLFSAYARAGKPLIKASEMDPFFRIMDLLQDQGAEILEVAPPGKPVIAAGVFVHYRDRTTYLVSAVDPAHKKTGVMTVLLWTALQRARERSRIFDFEGSMIEGIEGFFRGFGARPIPYLNIEKNDLPLLLQWIRDLR
ncbi:MAG: GNAT family N-acetyltransferase [Bacteroidota bacterium]